MRRGRSAGSPSAAGPAAGWGPSYAHEIEPPPSLPALGKATTATKGSHVAMPFQFEDFHGEFWFDGTVVGVRARPCGKRARALDEGNEPSNSDDDFALTVRWTDGTQETLSGAALADLFVLPDDDDDDDDDGGGGGGGGGGGDNNQEGDDGDDDEGEEEEEGEEENEEEAEEEGEEEDDDDEEGEDDDNDIHNDLYETWGRSRSRSRSEGGRCGRCEAGSCAASGSCAAVVRGAAGAGFAGRRRQAV